MVFYIVSCYKENESEIKIENIINGNVLQDNRVVLGELFPLTEGVKKDIFKVGSLDQLMELVDVFAKNEIIVDSSCKRNEKLYFDMAQELNMKDAQLQIDVPQNRGESKMKVLDYLKNFKWDIIRFQTDKSLNILGAKIVQTQKSCEDRLKKLLDEKNENKQKLEQLDKKSGSTLNQKDLASEIYENKDKCQANQFVNFYSSELMTSVLIVVSKKKEQSFIQNYWNYLIEHNKNDLENWRKRTKAQIQSNMEDIDEDELAFKLQEKEKDHQREMDLHPGVVPQSIKFLGITDEEGNKLYTSTCMKAQVVDYVKVLKKNGFQCQQFDYDAKKYEENQQLKKQLQTNMETLNYKILQTCMFNFQELFVALVHLKIMKTFVDSVLRFGIPPKFFMGIIKPKKNCDQKIMARLTTNFAEEHLKDMYGEKQDAQDEDFFPYVSTTLSSPVFLM